jgi:hypothetical protein
MSSAPLSKEKPMNSPAIPPRDTVIKKQQYLMGVCLILGLGRQNILVNTNTGQALLKA